MNHEDYEWYSKQVEKIEARFITMFRLWGLSGGQDFFDAVKDDLDMSLLWYWQFLCGFEADMNEAKGLKKGENRKRLLEIRAGQRIGRLTKQYLQFSSYVCHL